MHFYYLDFSSVVKELNLDVDKLYIDGAHYTPFGNNALAEGIHDFLMNKMEGAGIPSH